MCVLVFWLPCLGLEHSASASPRPDSQLPCLGLVNSASWKLPCSYHCILINKWKWFCCFIFKLQTHWRTYYICNCLNAFCPLYCYRICISTVSNSSVLVVVIEYVFQLSVTPLFSLFLYNMYFKATSNQVKFL